ncbi:MAG: hypothetical protein COA96_03560 [SAR86 cluster bacterium]|uniref:Methyltransferase type 11 domain-containing protein n=1 Tax=SAR86 cluster bacterium TaxID=2030880 RepID=A0A2A5B6V2_9GAMM|nr:MAG: hypothetical protein COA96_03560 [SAR86 cluster bacterium]
MIKSDFLNLLACPFCKGKVESVSDSEDLVCLKCQQSFQVYNNIPVMSVRKIDLPPMKKNDQNEDLFSSSTVYHLEELEIACNPQHPAHIMPEFKPEHEVILDIGCGVGQTYVAAELNSENKRMLVGLDIDIEAMNYGSNHYENINYVNAFGDDLPIQSESVDLLISRVSLLYTNIPTAFNEIHRVLKPGGEIWITLNPMHKQMQNLIKAIKRLSIKGVIARSFVMLNGVIFHFFGKVFPFPIVGGYESYQSEKAIRRLLEKKGFSNIKISNGTHFLITATK